MLVWKEEGGILKAVDDVAQYVVAPSEAGEGYDVFYLPAPGPLAEWARSVNELDRAKQLADECSLHVRRQRTTEAQDASNRAARRISARFVVLSLLLAGLLVGLFWRFVW